MGLDFEKRHQIISIDDVIFKGVMVRLMLVLAPIMCVVGGIGISSILTLYMRNYIEQANKQSSTSKSSGTMHYDNTRLSDYYGSNPVKVIILRNFFIFLILDFLAFLS